MIDRDVSEWPWRYVNLVDYCNGCGKQTTHVQRRRASTGQPDREWCVYCNLTVYYADE